MAILSNYAELAWLDHVLGTATWTHPAQAYLALSTTAPAEGGTNVTEPAATEYARLAINFSAASGRATSNSNALEFTDADEALGTITHWAIYDAVSAGNMLCYGAWDASQTIAAGESLTLAIGALDITVATGGQSNFAANEMLDHMLGVAAYTPPTNVYLALSTANPTDAGSGLTEPGATEYAREIITFNAASAGAADNSSAESFSDADEALGTISHFALMDAVSAGNMLFYGAFSVARAVGAGDTFTVAVGDIDLTAA